MEGWHRYKILEIADTNRWSLNGGPFGSNLTTKDYIESGVPVIRGINLPDDKRFSFEEFVWVSEEKADVLIANNAHPGDLVFTQRGTVGQVGLIPKDSLYRRFVISQSQMKLTPNQSIADELYLYYLFTSEAVVKEIKNLSFSSGVPHINLDILRNFEIELPPLNLQHRIASILSAYDDLIENNQRRIRILEDMARSLYREWFVKFRFPGHEKVRMVRSPLGDIPEGWEHTTFAQAAVFENGDRGSNYPSGSDFVDEGIPFINAGHLVDGAVDPSNMNYILAEKFGQLRSGKIREGDLLYCLRGSPGRIARTAGILRGAIASSLVIIRPSEHTNEEFLYYTLAGEVGKRMATELDNGVAQPNVSVGSVQKYPLLLPPIDLLREFATLIEPIWRHLAILRGQLSNLRKQRDLLLPRLMSGQIDMEAGIHE